MFSSCRAIRALPIVLLVLAAARAEAAPLVCVGDCNDNRVVSIDELVRGVSIALGDTALDQCSVLDCNASGQATIDCLVRAINAGLGGCPSNVPSPTLEGPVSGGSGSPFVAATTFDLAEVGYTQVEYFVAGTAAAYVNVEPLANDGRWSVEPDETAAYRTRILVHRPIDPARFNGTVLVEWLNVSGGLDAAPDWILTHTELTREGYAWVGVSAQYVGIEGGAGIPGLPPLPLKTVDPIRYAALVHPGDSFSYDIFSQVGQAIRRPAGANPLGDLPVERVIAAGESQSAFRMVTYINAIHPLARIYDGFLVHSRGSFSGPLSEAPQADIPVPDASAIRSDRSEPVLTFQTETDLTLLGYAAARQPDDDRFRLWEVAGTAHADTYTTGVGMTDRGDSPDATRLVVTTKPVEMFDVHCPVPINSGPQQFVLRAAIAALNRWVVDGTPPPTAARLELTEGPPVAFVRDANGNALGGIRTPQVDVPIAAFSGEGQSGSVLCLLFGSTAPFDDPLLAALYPTHDAYVSAFTAATNAAVQAGFVLPHDAGLMIQHAEQGDIGG